MFPFAYNYTANCIIFGPADINALFLRLTFLQVPMFLQMNSVSHQLNQYFLHVLL